MNIKQALKVAIPCLGMGLYSGLAHSGSCSDAILANPAYNPQDNTLTVPLVTTENKSFLGATLQVRHEQGNWFADLGETENLEKCTWDDSSSASFDFTTNILFLSNVQVADSVESYDLELEWDGNTFKLGFIAEGERRFAGRIFNSSNGEPIAEAVVTVDGVEADSPTTEDGLFQVTGIGDESCLMMTVNAPGFAPMSLDVDTRYSGEIRSCTP
ncbi:MAG: hypothetical protein ABFS56_10690 [Pseudomonadota bacterium]